MKNWKKWLAAAFTAAVVSVGSLTVVHGQTLGYERWETVAEEERITAAYGEKDSKEKVHPKAWKKINGICYNGSGKQIPGAITRGIDVSEWQEKINWKKVKGSDVDFAFVRISYGTGHLDKTYDYNMEQAELAGMPVGTYVYSTATTTEQALAEAQLAIEKMDGYKVSYPVVYDLEYSKMGNLTKKQVSNLARTFCEEVRSAGYYPMVYCNTNWYKNEVDWSLLEDYDVWLAEYGDKISAPSHAEYDYTIWQSTDGYGGGLLNSTKGLIDGIPIYSNVDINFGFVDYTKIVQPRKYTAAGYKPSRHPAIDIDGNEWGKKEGWQNENGKTYYYSNGRKLTDWNKIDGKYYYFHTKTGALHRNELLVFPKNTYYVGEDGARVIGQWVTYKGNKYYMSSSGGRALKGSKKIDGKYYRFYSKSGAMYRNRRVVDKAGNIFYYGDDGARYENGFHKVKIGGETKTYYFRNGKAYKGWLVLDGKKYYFYKGTAPLSGTRAENVTLTDSRNIVSVFDKNGVCIKQYQKKK